MSHLNAQQFRGIYGVNESRKSEAHRVTIHGELFMVFCMIGSTDIKMKIRLSLQTFSAICDKHTLNVNVLTRSGNNCYTELLIIRIN